jgi:hypothetical protein
MLSLPQFHSLEQVPIPQKERLSGLNGQQALVD